MSISKLTTPQNLVIIDKINEIIDGKQDTLTQSTGINISNATISVTDYAKLIKNTGSGNHAIGIGEGSAANSNNAIGLGYNAKGYAVGAIQIGTGTNSTANSLSVGFYSYSTNWQLLDGVTGYIPDARLNMDSAPTSASTHTVTSGGVYTAISNMQTTTNLVTSVSSSSTDTQYPSAKLFYDTVGNIESILQNINSGSN